MLIGGRVEADSIFIVVPARCVFTVDRRINPEEDVERERQALFDVFAASRRDGVSVDVDVLQVARPSGIMASTRVSKTASASWPRCGLTGSPWSSVTRKLRSPRP
jgi:acetylornithine deacetylase/succinyl-diaminopimelate desuccinylase-like protein